jgi:hypothetical protein
MPGLFYFSIRAVVTSAGYIRSEHAPFTRHRCAKAGVPVFVPLNSCACCVLRCDAAQQPVIKVSSPARKPLSQFDSIFLKSSLNFVMRITNPSELSDNERLIQNPRTMIRLHTIRFHILGKSLARSKHLYFYGAST